MARQRGRPPSAKTLVDRQLGRNRQVIPATDTFRIPNYSGINDFNKKGEAVYGEIFAEDNTTPTTINTIGTFEQVTIFDTNGESNNCTSDHTNDHITIIKEGRYLINVSVVIQSGGGISNVAHLHLAKNNDTTEYANVHAHRAMGGGTGDRGSISMNGIVNLSVGDTVELWLTNDTNTQYYIVEDVTLSIVQIDR